MEPITMPLSGAAAQAPTGEGKADVATVPPVKAEPAKAKTPDLADKMNPAARKVLEQRAAAKAVQPAIDPKPGAAAAAAPGAATPPAKTEKPSDEAKPGDSPESGVISFAEPGTVKAGAEEGTGSEGLIELTPEDAADLSKVTAKLTEAHKDNATQRRLKREAVEAADKLKLQIADLNKQVEEARTQQSQPAAGGYLDRFTKVEEVTAAHRDALETIKQLGEDPERETIVFKDGRVWNLGSGEESLAARATATALEILETHDHRVKQLTGRAEAEKLVAEKLPVLTKAVPEFDKRYKAALQSDWQSDAPKLALHASIGELVTSGEYTLVPRSSRPAASTAAKTPETKPAPKTPSTELPNAQPPMRPVEPGQKDLTELRAKAFKGDPKALKQWIAESGKARKA